VEYNAAMATSIKVLVNRNGKKPFSDMQKALVVTDSATSKPAHLLLTINCNCLLFRKIKAIPNALSGHRNLGMALI
jgi:hypothetical protein